MTDLSDAIFREYDIRGTFGADLTAEVAELIGRAYPVFASKGGTEQASDFTITVGRDVRKSSNALRDALIKGLTMSGVNCIDVGECPTPLQYFSMHALPVSGGVMITGSHNPPEYNGFKISVGKETIHGRDIKEIAKIINYEIEGMPYQTKIKPGRVESVDIISKYIEDVAKRFALPKLKRPLKVVLDSGNGTAGPVAPKLLSKIGCEVVELFSKPDGNFPNHHPDPTVPAHLKDLIATVKKEGADFGVAYDGDADRIGVVDEAGGIIWGDKLMVIFSRAILEKEKGATIVGEVKCSQVMYDEIKKAGGNPVMWKTGHSLIKAKMKEAGAAMAGEMSGHIFFADKWYGFDDAIYSSCRLVEILAEKREKDPGFKFSQLLAGVPSTIVTPEIRVDCPDDAKFEVIERLDKAVGEGTADFKVNDVIKIDGLRINFDGGWALVRASNTQPVLVLRFEAASDALLEKAKAFVRERFKNVRPGMEPGF